MTTTTNTDPATASPAATSPVLPPAADAGGPPQFATRADRDAFYRAKYYAERGLNPDGSDPRMITISMTPAQARAFYNATMAVGHTWKLVRFCWNVAALFTVMVFLAFLVGALTA